MPISDNQNSLRATPRGPTLLEDFVLREKITHFDHERIPERIVHARGSAAHGYFELTKSLAKYTTANLFTEVGVRTPVFTRFSTVAGGAGSVDTPRDVRGFAVKFYTQQGNFDLVGNNIPVFFIQDAMKFPDLVHSVKMEPDRAYPQAGSAHDTFWDFISLTPESMHMIMWAMSDRTIPRSLRMIEGFGVHAFRLLDAKGRSTFCKFHWRPRLGLQSTVWDEAVKLQGADNDFHRRDLFEAIQAGNFPAWDFGVQLFTEEQADAFPFDHLDPTKLIPEELVPLTMIGHMVLDRWPDNFFAETEQVAYCPANIVPGIDFSNDPLLQGRLFSYLDTQLSRLGGPNFHQIPINAPKCPFANQQRDGHMQMQVPRGRVNYEPSTLDPTSARATPAGFRSFAEPADDESKGRIRFETFADHYSQPRMFYRSQTRVRTGAHGRVAGVRAVEGRNPARARGASSATCATSTPTSPSASPTASAWTSCRRHRSPRRRRHRHAALARAADHRQDEADARGPRRRHPGRRRFRCRAPSSRCARPPRMPAPRSRSSPRNSVAPPCPTAGNSRPTASSPARHRWCSTPWRWCCPTTPASAWRRKRPQSISSAMPTATSRRSPPMPAHKPC